MAAAAAMAGPATPMARPEDSENLGEASLDTTLSAAKRVTFSTDVSVFAAARPQQDPEDGGASSQVGSNRHGSKSSGSEGNGSFNLERRSDISTASMSSRGSRQAEPLSRRELAFCLLQGLSGLYLLVLALALLGEAVECLGGKSAGNLLRAVENPVAGLASGVLATFLVQSSSTSTGIVSALVGAEQIAVKAGLPIVAGANLGSGVTSAIVAMGMAGDRVELQRAFAGASLHGIFNALVIASLLPAELLLGAALGEGGVLYWLAKSVTGGAATGAGQLAEPFTSPTTGLTLPLAEALIANNKHVISALSLGAPARWSVGAGSQNTTACNGLRRLEAAQDFGSSPGRRLSERDFACSQYYCLSENLASQLKMISEPSYSKLKQCRGFVSNPSCSGGQECFLDAGNYYEERVTNGRILGGGLFEGLGDVAGGLAALMLALLLLASGLCLLTLALRRLFHGRVKRLLRRAERLNAGLFLLLGFLIAFIVQSSSVVTAVLVPFCGTGVLSLPRMLPLTLGAELGSASLSLLAAATSGGKLASRLALCRLLLSSLGVLLWLPAPRMRRCLLSAAELLGVYASFFRIVPVLYVLSAFLALPGLALAVSAACGASLPAGIALLLALLGLFVAFEYWWLRREGCYHLLSKKAREKGVKEMMRAQEKVMGDGNEEESKSEPGTPQHLAV